MGRVMALLVVAACALLTLGAGGAVYVSAVAQVPRVPFHPTRPAPLGCPPYPVWIVELKSPSCNVTVAVNGHAGRFGGAGTDGCDLVPQAAPANWFVPFWE